MSIKDEFDQSQRRHDRHLLAVRLPEHSLHFVRTRERRVSDPDPIRSNGASSALIASRTSIVTRTHREVH